jgi:molybdate transport system regulatory protein
MPAPKRRATGTNAAARKRSTPRATLGAKIWVEIDGKPALTDAGADLLEQLAVCGSVSEAARRLHFSYRRAWMLVDAMNKRWPAPLVTKSIGGDRGGGTKFTPTGASVLRSYRDLQHQLEHFLDRATTEFTASLDRVRPS